MANTMRETVIKNRQQEVSETLFAMINNLNSDGYSVEFGNIGKRTTYAYLYTKDYSEEYVGYTYLYDYKYYDESVGKLKALQQAIARKSMPRRK